MITRIVTLNRENTSRADRVRAQTLKVPDFAWDALYGHLRPDDNPRSVEELADVLRDRLDVARYKVSPPALSDSEFAIMMEAFRAPIPGVKDGARVFARIEYPWKVTTPSMKVVFVEFESGTHLSIAHLFFAHIMSFHHLVDPALARNPKLSQRGSQMLRDVIGHLMYNGTHDICTDLRGDVLAFFGCDA